MALRPRTLLLCLVAVAAALGVVITLGAMPGGDGSTSSSPGNSAASPFTRSDGAQRRRNATGAVHWRGERCVRGTTLLPSIVAACIDHQQRLQQWRRHRRKAAATSAVALRALPPRPLPPSTACATSPCGLWAAGAWSRPFQLDDLRRRAAALDARAEQMKARNCSADDAVREALDDIARGGLAFAPTHPGSSARSCHTPLDALTAGERDGSVMTGSVVPPALIALLAHRARPEVNGGRVGLYLFAGDSMIRQLFRRFVAALRGVPPDAPTHDLVVRDDACYVVTTHGDDLSLYATSRTDTDTLESATKRYTRMLRRQGSGEPAANPLRRGAAHHGFKRLQASIWNSSGAMQFASFLVDFRTYPPHVEHGRNISASCRVRAAEVAAATGAEVLFIAAFLWNPESTFPRSDHLAMQPVRVHTTAFMFWEKRVAPTWWGALTLAAKASVLQRRLRSASRRTPGGTLLMDPDARTQAATRTAAWRSNVTSWATERAKQVGAKRWILGQVARLRVLEARRTLLATGGLASSPRYSYVHVDVPLGSKAELAHTGNATAANNTQTPAPAQNTSSHNRGRGGDDDDDASAITEGSMATGGGAAIDGFDDGGGTTRVERRQLAAAAGNGSSSSNASSGSLALGDGRTLHDDLVPPGQGGTNTRLGATPDAETVVILRKNRECAERVAELHATCRSSGELPPACRAGVLPLYELSLRTRHGFHRADPHHYSCRLRTARLQRRHTLLLNATIGNGATAATIGQLHRAWRIVNATARTSDGRWVLAASGLGPEPDERPSRVAAVNSSPPAAAALRQPTGTRRDTGRRRAATTAPPSDQHRCDDETNYALLLLWTVRLLFDD